MAVRHLTEIEYDSIKLMHTDGKGRNDIAKALSRSPATISKAAHKMGLSFDRSKVAAATKAKQADNKARRALLEADLLEDAQKLRKQLWEPCIAFNFGGKDNTYNETNLERPVFTDQLKIMQAAGAAVTHSLKIAAVDADSGDEEAKSMLIDLFASMGQAWHAGIQ